VASCNNERERVTKEGMDVKWQVDTWRVGPAALQVITPCSLNLYVLFIRSCECTSDSRNHTISFTIYKFICCSNLISVSRLVMYWLVLSSCGFDYILILLLFSFLYSLFH
jgi:hypothetical protein